MRRGIGRAQIRLGLDDARTHLLGCALVDHERAADQLSGDRDRLAREPVPIQPGGAVD